MIPNSFDYHSPDSVDEAIRLLSELGEGAQLLAGGHSLLPMMKLRFTQPTHLIDLNRVNQLKDIRVQDGNLLIGAMTTQNELIQSPLIQQNCPLLAEAARWIADHQVRNCGTLGGNIMHGDPAGHYAGDRSQFCLTGTKGRTCRCRQCVFSWTLYNDRASDEILT